MLGSSGPRVAAGRVKAGEMVCYGADSADVAYSRYKPKTINTQNNEEFFIENDA